MLTLTLGNKAYSSWSLRAWLALRATGVPFAETVIPLDQPDSAARLRQASPSGLVPVLAEGPLVVWDSLAIAEYVAERHPAARLWPVEPHARAIARSLSAEMHAGFSALRRHMPMDLKRDWPGHGRVAAVQPDLARLTTLWRERLTAAPKAEGPFLFGAWSLADIAYAPVCTRLRTYGIDLEAPLAAYRDAVLSHPDMLAWQEAARAEPWDIQYSLVTPADAAW